MSLREAAQFIPGRDAGRPISYPTVLRLVDKGHLRAVQVGSIKRITLDELNRFLRHGNYPAGAQEEVKAEEALKMLQESIEQEVQGECHD